MVSPELLAFFESFRTEADLQRLVDDREQENIHLEFKKKKERGHELHESDKFQFSRALSGFANSDGGILIWGVGTAAEDRASALVPIDNVGEFQGRLKKILLNAVQPMVDQVRIETVASSGLESSGYVSCLIPASDKAPHRAMLASREYFKRSTEGFYRLEHFDLEDMFGRRPVPRLELSARIIQSGSIGGGGSEQYKGLAVLAITNSGRGSAKAPYLALKVSGTYTFARYGIDGNGNEGLPRRTTTDPKRMVFTSYDVVIHPGLTHEVTGIEVSTHVGHKLAITLPPDLTIDYELSAENSQLQSGTITILSKDIAKAVLPTGINVDAL
jgi:hypothetical protein